MKKILLAALLLSVCALLPGAAWAQAETSGRVTGTITNEAGEPVEGVTLTFSSPSMQGERVIRTDSQGRYTAALLPSGNYLVDISAPGFQPLQYSFRVGIGQNVPLSPTLTAGEGIVERVRVTGTASEMKTTTLGENLNYEDTIDELPVVDRRLESVADLAPNISEGPTDGTLSIAGAPSFDTVVLLDGSEISDPYFGSAPTVYFEEAIEEVQVLTSGISAKYGRFQGGVVNAVTKSGGNTFDGTLRADISKEDWNQQTPEDEPQSDDLTEVYSGTFGGPIVRDRLWFFLGARTIPTDSASATTILTNEPYTTVREEDRYQLKLTGSINPDHTLEGSYLNFDATSTGRAGLPPADTFAATGIREDPREIYTLEYQGILTPNLFLNVQGTKKEVSIASGASDPGLGSPFLDLGEFAVWNNHWWDFNDPSVRDNDTISAGLTQILSTADWGSHTFEYGIQYVKSTTGGENRQTSTGLNLLNYDAFLLPGVSFSNATGGFDPMTDTPMFNLINGDPVTGDGGLTFRWVALPLGGDQELENTAIYAQDTWEIGKWRFDAGLRFEQYDGSGPSPIFDMDFDQLSPRLGVTYNIDQNWQLQAFWGKYVSRLNDNVASAITGVGGAPYVEQIYTGPTACTIGTHCLTYADVEAALQDDSNWGIVTAVTDPTQPTRFLAGDIEAPYANDLNLSIKRALPRNTGAFTITYTNREYKNLMDDFIGEGAHPEIANMASAITTVTDPLGSGDMFDLDTTIWDNAPTARRDYDALTATVDYRPTVKWNVGGNWTYSFTEGNYEGEGQNTPSSGSVIGDYPAARIGTGSTPYGFLDEDIRHRVRAWASYDFDFGRAGSLTVGTIGRYQSGAPYNLTGSVAYEDLGQYENEAGQSYTYFVGGRGNQRFNSFWRADLSGRYDILIGRDVNAYIKLDILNVTNNDELISFRTTGSVAFNGVVPEFVPGVGFGEPRNEDDYQLPRSYFLSAGFTF